MTEFCPECGAKLLPNARFCSKCRTAIEQETVTVQTEVPTSGFCGKCGAPLLVGAVCCSKCGTRVGGTAAQPETQQPANTQNMRTQAANIRNTAAQLGRVTTAPVQGGEFALDMPYVNSLDGAGELMSPFKAVFSGVTRIISGVKNIKSNPAALISAAVTAVMWVVFMIWNRSGKANKFSEVMSFLTFAEGGSFGSVANKIGGLCGKGVVVSAVMSLFNGSLRNLPASFKAMFSKGMNIGLMVMGIGLAVTAYRLFAGYAGTYGAMVAVCGAGLSMNALGGGAGYLRTLAVSLTSRKKNGVRAERGVKSKSLLTGLTSGFMLAAALSKFDYIIWIPVGVAIIGLILSFVIPEKGGAEQ